MSIGNNKAEQELTALLASTLVRKEVMEPMDKIGWGHGTPPPPDYGTTPKTEVAPGPAGTPAPNAPPSGLPASSAEGKPGTTETKAGTPAPGFEFNIEDFKNPVTGKYFEKYDSPAEALKGLGHLAHLAKTAFSDRDAANTRLSELAAENQRLRSTPVGDAPTAPVPSSTPLASRADVDRAKASLDAVLSRVAEDGGVLDAESAKELADAQSELSNQQARFALAESRANEQRVADTEKARWKAVDDYMDSKYPKANQFATEIGLHVQSDPLLSEAVAALVAQHKETKASELAWLSFERTLSADQSSRAAVEKVEEDLAAREQVRKEAVERARKDAGVVTGSAGGAGIHENLDAGASSQDEINALAREMGRTGEAPGSSAAVRWRHAIIGRYLDPSLFGGK